MRLGASVHVGIGALLFIAGYSFCRYAHEDERYSIMRREGKPYLFDGERKTRLPIDEKGFQVGSIEYRLEGLLRDRRLPQVLAQLSGGEER